MSWLNQLLAWCRGFFQFLFGLLQSVFAWIWDGISWLFKPLLEWVTGRYDELANYLSIPTTAYLRDLWATADMWLPLTEGMQLATLFFAVQCVLIAVRLAMKVIPGLG